MATKLSTLGEAIKAARTEHGWKRWELAQRLGIDPQNIARWERGENRPSLPMYERLCALFDWPLPYEFEALREGPFTQVPFLASPAAA